MLKLDAMSEKTFNFANEFNQLLPAETGETHDLGLMRAQRWLEDWNILKTDLEKEVAAWTGRLEPAKYFLSRTHEVRIKVDSFVKRRYNAAVRDFEQEKGCSDFVNDLARCWNVEPHYVWIQRWEVNLTHVEPHKWHHTMLKAYMQVWGDEEKRIRDGATVYRYFAYPKARFDDTDGADDDLLNFFPSSERKVGEGKDGERKVGYLLRGGWFCGVRYI